MVVKIRHLLFQLGWGNNDNIPRVNRNTMIVEDGNADFGLAGVSVLLQVGLTPLIFGSS